MTMTYVDKNRLTREMQQHLADALKSVEAAQKIADELGQEINFLGQTYRPTTVIKGMWSQASEDAWGSSAGEY